MTRFLGAVGTVVGISGTEQMVCAVVSGTAANEVGGILGCWILLLLLPRPSFWKSLPPHRPCCCFRGLGGARDGATGSSMVTVVVSVTVLPLTIRVRDVTTVLVLMPGLAFWAAAL